jgi:shikimate kinase
VDSKTNIALVGFMGTGKTAVGRALSHKLRRQFVELDTIIAERTGKPIMDIFRDDGEIAFREMEIAVTKEVVGSTNLVIACGGGLVLNRINVDRLQQNGRIVYLTAAPSVILKRTAGAKNERPLLETTDRAAKIREMLSFRKPFYERAADFKINTSRLSVESIVTEIINRLQGDAGFSF